MQLSYIVFDRPGATSFRGYPAPMQADDTVTLVTLAFDATDPASLVGALARYVVLSRGHAGCRNIDLCQSVARPERFVVVEKWESPAAQRAHLDSPEFTELARACQGLLTGPPDVELLDGLSAHDLA
jgi:quinol monooxygenase YgiN